MAANLQGAKWKHREDRVPKAGVKIPEKRLTSLFPSATIGGTLEEGEDLEEPVGQLLTGYGH